MPVPRKRLIHAIIAVAAPGAALAAAYNFEWITFNLAQRAARTLAERDYQIAGWAPELLSLLLAGGLVTLVWWQATRAAYPRAIDLLYLFAGLAAVLYEPLIFTLHLQGWPLLGFGISGHVYFWFMTGAVLTLAGLFHLLRPADRG